METTALIFISAGIAIVLGLSIWAVSVSWHWVMFGVRLWYYDWRTKKRTGFLWIVDN
jgi:hypothetical protein